MSMRITYVLGIVCSCTRSQLAAISGAPVNAGRD